jgi:hypothetical protein
MVSALGTSVQDDSEDGGSIDSFHGALHYLRLIAKVLMSEEDSEEEFSDEGTTPVGGPSVITFQDPSKKSEASASDRTLKKAFMVRDSYEVFSFTPLNDRCLQVVESFQTTARKSGSNKESKTQ